MALLTVQKVTAAGIGPTFAAANAGGDAFANNGRTMVVVKNDGASSITVTITSARTCNQGFLHDLTISVPAGAERWIGPFAPWRFNDESGQVAVGYSAVTSVTVAAIEL